MTQRDVMSRNLMIDGYTSNGLAEQGLYVFVEMLASGIVSNRQIRVVDSVRWTRRCRSVFEDSM
ncbi:unnamed protein product [Arabis nemorensis]|uniref:Pentatricopeptide repeat-containing protein n=1 Tax=Arabis nemorensis TaxID=586526 RepID=A0A565CX01_9BRAS|nr:unnamed protein product [Arabis nemorensis]